MKLKLSKQAIEAAIQAAIDWPEDVSCSDEWYSNYRSFEGEDVPATAEYG